MSPTLEKLVIMTTTDFWRFPCASKQPGWSCIMQACPYFPSLNVQIQDVTRQDVQLQEVKIQNVKDRTYRQDKDC